jgi:alginate O-acetyltransferase complex protein AlgI
VIGGLWHGPSWNFVIWGALHGAALAVARAWQTWRGNPPANPAWWARAARIAVTFQFVCFCWIFFRAPNLVIARQILEQIASGTMSLANVSAPLAIVLAIAAVFHYMPKNWYERLSGGFAEAPFFIQAAAMALLVLAIQYVAATGAAPFIYTKF